MNCPAKKVATTPGVETEGKSLLSDNSTTVRTFHMSLNIYALLACNHAFGAVLYALLALYHH